MARRWWYKVSMARRTPRARVLGAALVLALVTVAGASVASVRADDDPTLPRVSADRLLASVIEAVSHPASISGDVATTLDLGVPELPAAIAGGAGVPAALASLLGDQRWKVWSSPDGLRVAHLSPAREQDLVMNREDAWWWDSVELRAVHLDLEAFRRATGIPSTGAPNAPSAPSVDPVALAGALIRGVSPCASVSVQGTDRVAGRDVYVLALTPLSPRSLLGSVRLSIDAETRLPLSVEVRSIAGDAPIAAGFSNVSFDPIDPAMFAFDPPADADVSDLSDPSTAEDEPSENPTGREMPAITDTRVFGDCLGLIVAARVDGSAPQGRPQLLPYAGPLGSAIAIDRGDHAWILAGLVGADALEARAAALP